MIGGERRISSREQWLVEALLRASGRLDLIPDIFDTKVAEMDDGGMGSLLFAPPRGDRTMQGRLDEARFSDADGTPVSAVLNLDGAGAAFELDIWKVDFSPLQRLPQDGDVVEFRHS